jgi:hypothetical protein
MTRLPPLAAALLALAACQGAPSATTVPAGGEQGAAIYGQVRLARARVLAPSPPAYPWPPSPTPSGAEAPAVGAEVFVADAAGTRIPGIPVGTTNEDGVYRLRAVPLGYAYVVTAVYRDVDGRPLRLRTLARLVDRDLEAPIDTATTLAARAALGPHAGLLGGLTAETWARAAGAIARGLDPAALPDLGDPALMDAELDRLRAKDAALGADLDALRAEIAGTPAPSPAVGPSPSPS